MGISFYVRCCFVFAKVCVGDFKNPFCKLCGYSRLKNYGKTSFSRMIQVSNCNKRVHKNSRMFGCLVSFSIFLLRQMLLVLQSLRWRLKTVLQVVRIQSLENYGKTSFSRMIQVSNCNKRVQKNSRMFGCFGEFQHFPLRQMLFVFAKVCVGDFKKPFCKSCGYSRLKITAKHLFLG